jgi:hypothetical protein
MGIIAALGRSLLTRVTSLAAPRSAAAEFFGRAPVPPKEGWGN